MGDSIDFNETWGAGNVPLEGTGDLHESSGDEESPSHANESAPQATKSLKKKRKFLEMKQKKQLALSSAASDATVSANLTAVEQCATFSADTALVTDLKPENFFECTTKLVPSCVFASTIMASFPTFKKFIQKVAGLPTGSPTVLVLCSSARRAADVINSLSKTFKCVIAKLFAKHFKLQEHVEFVKTQQFHLAVGTPNRIAKLLEYGALHLDQTQLVLIDLFLDSKLFSVLSLPDTKADVVDLFTSWILPKVSASPDRIRLSLVAPTVDSKAIVEEDEEDIGDSTKSKIKEMPKKSVKLTNSKDKFRHPKRARK